MFTRHPSAILQHEVDHGGGDTGNDCLETVDDGEKCTLGFGGCRDTHGRRRRRGGAGQGRISFSTWVNRLTRERGLLGQQSAASSAVLERQATESSPIATLIVGCGSSHPGGPQREDARGTVEVQLLQRLGSFFKRAGQVCNCISERREESAHSAGAPVVRCSGRGDEGRQTSVCWGELVTGKSTTQRPQHGPSKKLSHCRQPCLPVATRWTWQPNFCMSKAPVKVAMMCVAMIQRPTSAHPVSAILI